MKAKVSQPSALHGVFPGAFDLDRVATIPAWEDAVGIEAADFGMLVHEGEGWASERNAARVVILRISKREVSTLQINITPT